MKIPETLLLYKDVDVYPPGLLYTNMLYDYKRWSKKTLDESRVAVRGWTCIDWYKWYQDNVEPEKD